MENYTKNLHKIKDYLSAEQIEQLEYSALSYRRFARIYFKIISFDAQNKELVVKVWQEKNPSENYIGKKDLNERAKTVFGRFFENYTIHTHPIPYVQPIAEAVTPEWIRERMKYHKITNKRLSEDLGLAKAELSALLNKHRQMGIRTKGLFYYYFKSL